MSKKKKSKNKASKVKGIDHNGISQRIMSLLNNNFGKSFSIKQITKKIEVRDAGSKAAVPHILFDLVDADKITRGSDGGFTSAQKSSNIIGKVDFVNPRFAYVIPEDGTEDILVKSENMGQALDEDTVAVQVYPSRNKMGRLEGRVVEIVHRFRTEFVGRIEISPRYAFVVPDFKKMHVDIFIRPEDIHQAQHGDKVIVTLKHWTDRDKNPTGVVERVLGKSGEHNAEIHSIMAEFGLPFEFEQEVSDFADHIPDAITKEEISKRRDFREVTTFTVDPEDAKDFDDALSIKPLPKGGYEIGIHIADVTHYVRGQNVLEKEAYNRATSVYLVDRTIPMLPERLSNFLCSLRPHEDKLTFSAVFEMDENGDVLNEWFGRTIIHSDRRFTYEEGQEAIDTQSGDFYKELTILDTLAKKLRKRRFESGAINFETVEVKFKLDEKGTPLGIIPKVRRDIHKMIEEFMLLANKRVAEFIFNKEKGKHTFVYRTHDRPDPEKLSTFSTFAKRFGHDLKIEDERVSKSLNKLMADIDGKPEQNVLEQLAIRSMAKAKYTTETNMHFGLAFKHYTHFTSPIRRYPDMMVHRLLQHYLDGGKPVDKEDFEAKCLHSSEREKRAADAERASIKYKQVEYMAISEKRPYDGIISGVTEWGLYIEITETKCEGMVRISDIEDDYYSYDEKNYRLVGQRSQRVYTLGDKVTVIVKNTDINRRTIDLEFANPDGDTKKVPARGRRRN